MAHRVARVWTAHGLTCAVLENLTIGHRCGYVGVWKGHPLYGVDYSSHSAVLVEPWEDVKDGPIGDRGVIPLVCRRGDEVTPDCFFDVHGGLTYSGGAKDYPIKNPLGLWWFGFDCGHAGDRCDPLLLPARLHSYFSMQDGEVRDEQYVVEQCERLAEQLAKFKTNTEEA